MTKLAGILNITPDSFSDGGRYNAPEAAYLQAHALINDGADIIDIGAESTRPNAQPLDSLQEWQRLEPVLSDIIRLAHKSGRQVSVDTRHPQTARRAIVAGADWINDVSGGRDETMLEIIAQADCGFVLMHALTIPADKAVTLPADADVVSLIYAYFSQMIEACEKHGISRHRLALDAGLGFGKTPQQSLELLWRMPEFTALGCALYVGHSRKSCFSLIGDAAHRDALTLLASHYLFSHNIDYVRVHDIGAHATLRNSLKPLPENPAALLDIQPK